MFLSRLRGIAENDGDDAGDCTCGGIHAVIKPMNGRNDYVKDSFGALKKSRCCRATAMRTRKTNLRL